MSVFHFYLFNFFIDFLFFKPAVWSSSPGPACFLHALTSFDKLALFEGCRLFSIASTTTVFSLHCCELKRDFALCSEGFPSPSFFVAVKDR